MSGLTSFPLAHDSAARGNATIESGAQSFVIGPNILWPSPDHAQNPRVEPIKAIYPPEGPAALGHYSPGTQAGPFLFVSGQIAVTPAGESLAHADLATQSLQALKNMAGVVRAAGGRTNDVVKITVYLADPQGWPVFNEIYAKFFDGHRPARAVVPVQPFHGGFLVEVEAVAYLARFAHAGDPIRAK